RSEAQIPTYISYLTLSIVCDLFILSVIIAIGHLNVLSLTAYISSFRVFPHLVTLSYNFWIQRSAQRRQEWRTRQKYIATDVDN
ncbi:hypothetical protein V8E54_008584, partial [Elaphomyces granulatus]